MSIENTPRILRNALIALAGVSCLAVLGATVAEAAQPGDVATYFIQAGEQQQVLDASIVEIIEEGPMSIVRVDGLDFSMTVGEAIIVQTDNSDDQMASYSDTTITDLPGGGQRIDIDNGDGSSTTIIDDPNGGPNGGTRETTSTTDSEGNTTTVTTTTDGNDGSKKTTITKDKKK